MSTPYAPLAPSKRVVSATLRDGEGVLVDTATACYFGLNRTAAFLWKALEDGDRAGQPPSAGRLVDELCEAFDVPRAVAEADVTDFLATLGHHGLATAAARPSGDRS